MVTRRGSIYLPLVIGYSGRPGRVSVSVGLRPAFKWAVPHLRARRNYGVTRSNGGENDTAPLVVVSFLAEYGLFLSLTSLVAGVSLLHSV